MNGQPLDCAVDQRRLAVRERGRNGIDAIEVSDDQRTLTLSFLNKLERDIDPRSVVIEGGHRIRTVRVSSVRPCRPQERDLDDCLQVEVEQPGDFSTYTLRLAGLDGDGRPTNRPLAGFDRRYASRRFTFKDGCGLELDCAETPACPPVVRPEPALDYLAKDYASFRQLILDRLSLTMPEWRERHVPDLGIALVEVLAYTGDYLSYYQDAVATEAYLETARRRVSVRRHARLVDYQMHEGCNARAWLTLQTSEDLSLRPDRLSFLAGDLPPARALLNEEDLRGIPADSYEVFQPLVHNPAAPIRLYRAHNEIPIYTWGDAECCLPRGATSATLLDMWLGEAPGETGEETAEERAQLIASGETRALRLRPGDVLIFEETLGPRTGVPADADRGHRHAVRLTRVQPDVDDLFQPSRPLLTIEWAAEDALPFDLCLSSVGPPPACAPLLNVSVARGNVLLVEHGRTRAEEPLGTVETAEVRLPCDAVSAESELLPATFRPSLRFGPLVFHEPLPARASTAGLLRQDPRRALPALRLTASRPGVGGENWQARPDLLGSGPGARDYVVEMDDDGIAQIRFGDGVNGRLPAAGTRFRATYRTGDPAAGNVGAETITAALLHGEAMDGLDLRPRNPMPAAGGLPPEPVAQAKLLAPYAFRDTLERAVTAEDYATIVQRAFPTRVQRAKATLRWTGSRYEALVAVDPLRGDRPSQEGRAAADDGGLDGPPAEDAPLLTEVATLLRGYQRLGHDLVVEEARTVALDLGLSICVRPGYLRAHVRTALLERLSNRTLPDGGRGLFHPDNLSFGEGVALSMVVAVAQAVAGVESVSVTKLQRAAEEPNGEIERGILPLGPLEIARLENDPSFPENGTLSLKLEGGR